MSKNFMIVCCMAAGICLVDNGFCIQVHAEAQKHLSRKELHKQVREAHTTEQYRALAEYFRAEQSRFESMAKMEESELARLRENPAAVPGKYPTRIDSANHFYQYYMLKADEMGRRVAEFEEKIALSNRNTTATDRR